jgi:hypothetical protein
MTDDLPLPVYAIVERRQDGPMRVLCERVDPRTALAYADQMRIAGGSVEVVLITSIAGDA